MDLVSVTKELKKKTPGNIKHTKLGSLLRKYFFLSKSSSFKMGLVLDLVRHQQNKARTQNITCFQSHKMTQLRIHFCPFCVWG